MILQLGHLFSQNQLSLWTLWHLFILKSTVGFSIHTHSATSDTCDRFGTDKDPIARAKANFALFQYDSLVAPHWGKLSRQGNGDVDAFLKGLKEWQQHLPDEALEDEYGVADIKLGPFIVRPR